jgi:hypothetical protein
MFIWLFFLDLCPRYLQASNTLPSPKIAISLPTLTVSASGVVAITSKRSIFSTTQPRD